MLLVCRCERNARKAIILQFQRCLRQSVNTQERLHVLVGEPVRPGAFGTEDALEIRDGRRQVIVHDDVIELTDREDLLPRPGEPALDLGLGIRPPPTQPPFQLSQGGRRDEQHACLRQPLPDLTGTGAFELDQYILPRFKRFYDRSDRCAVEIIDVLGVLEQLLAPDQLKEMLPADEMVVLAIDLPWPLLAGSG